MRELAIDSAAAIPLGTSHQVPGTGRLAAQAPCQGQILTFNIICFYEVILHKYVLILLSRYKHMIFKEKFNSRT